MPILRDYAAARAGDADGDGLPDYSKSVAARNRIGLSGHYGYMLDFARLANLLKSTNSSDGVPAFAGVIGIAGPMSFHNASLALKAPPPAARVTRISTTTAESDT